MTQARCLELRVSRIQYLADHIHSFEFCQPDGGELPGFTAGAHIDLHLPNGLIRSYSLSNDPVERHRYVVAVNRDPQSRGGSSFVHDKLKVGQMLQVGEPRNHFQLNEEAPHTVFIAGGIGITPIRSMISRLDALGRSWELFYSTRRQCSTAYLHELGRLGRQAHAKVHFNFSQEPGGQRLDIARVISQTRAGAHFYCCGPAPLLQAFQQGAGSLPAKHMHMEYFGAKELPAVTGGFQVELARTKRVVAVPQGKSILEALLDAGVNVAYACMEGVCGACETRVLAGQPDHRDLVLSSQEQAVNDRMMICCSGSKCERLILDL